MKPHVCHHRHIYLVKWLDSPAVPKPTYLESGINITIPSREPGRDIPCRMFMPEKGEAKGIYMHTHGGGWVCYANL